LGIFVGSYIRGEKVFFDWGGSTFKLPQAVIQTPRHTKRAKRKILSRGIIKRFTIKINAFQTIKKSVQRREEAKLLISKKLVLFYCFYTFKQPKSYII